MTNTQFIKTQTWRLVVIALFFIVAAFCTSCGRADYSPLDSYIKAEITRTKDSAYHRHQMEQYLEQLKKDVNGNLNNQQIEITDTTGRFFSPNASVIQYIIDHPEIKH